MSQQTFNPKFSQIYNPNIKHRFPFDSSHRASGQQLLRQIDQDLVLHIFSFQVSLDHWHNVRSLQDLSSRLFLEHLIAPIFLYGIFHDQDGLKIEKWASAWDFQQCGMCE